MHATEIVGYPDSKKIGAMAAPRGERWLRLIARESSAVDYYDGEDAE
jgi:hypothetical protein